jgi:hypothetical protein
MFTGARAARVPHLAHGVPRLARGVTFPSPAPPAKPALSEFRDALLHCFLLASTTYVALHTVWYVLELAERERELAATAAALETRIQALVDAKKAPPPRSRWFFWR